MKTLVEYPLDEGGFILVEVVEDSGIARASRAGDLAARATMSLEAAWQQVSPAIRSVLKSIRDPETQADEVDLEFGVKLTGTTSAVIASTGCDFHFKVNLKWKRTATKAESPV